MKREFSGFLLVGAFVIGSQACASDSQTQEVKPSSQGQRGESCEARNDCAAGLACMNRVCSRNDFDLSIAAKHCDRVDCREDADCCGTKPLEAPPECANRDVICTPNLPGCSPLVCTSDGECGGGMCQPGYCSVGGDPCMTSADCVDQCSGGFCTLTSYSCTTNASCLGQGSCESRTCDCSNPQYDPSDPICTNPDCVDFCTLRCDEELCVEDATCEDDFDCITRGRQFCDGGQCVDCRSDDDCSASAEESCVDHVCQVPCTRNEECPLFHRCDAGECIESGCSSDRECVLAAGQTSVGEDARLSRCLASDEDPAIKACKVPCENDGACGQFQVCEAGYCRFVGCESDEECRGYLGLVDQAPTPERPFVPRAICRE